MPFIDRDELIKALDARAAMIEGMLAHVADRIDAIDGVETPEHVREMMRLIDARVSAELPWAKAFKARLAAGEYRTSATRRGRRSSRTSRSVPQAAATRRSRREPASRRPSAARRKPKR